MFILKSNLQTIYYLSYKCLRILFSHFYQANQYRFLQDKQEPINICPSTFTPRIALTETRYKQFYPSISSLSTCLYIHQLVSYSSFIIRSNWPISEHLLHTHPAILGRPSLQESFFQLGDQFFDHLVGKVEGFSSVGRHITLLELI